MHLRRVLRLLDKHLKFTCYTWHSFNRFGTYSFSKTAATLYAFWTVLYIGTLYIHYTQQQYVEQYRLLSKFYYSSIYRHLYIGCAIAILIPLSFPAQRRFMQDMGDFIRNQQLRGRWDLMELFVYYKIYSNLIGLVGLETYNLIMLNWRKFAWFKLMLLLGLFLPHFCITNILNYFCVHALLLRQACANINDDLLAIHSIFENKNTIQSSASHESGGFGFIKKALERLFGRFRVTDGTKCSSVTLLETFDPQFSLDKRIAENLRQFMQIQSLSKRLNSLLQMQLFAMSAYYASFLFVAAHSLLKIEQKWPLYVLAADVTSLDVNFKVDLCFILNDLVCLFAVGSFYRTTVSYWL